MKIVPCIIAPVALAETIPVSIAVIRAPIIAGPRATQVEAVRKRRATVTPQEIGLAK